MLYEVSLWVPNPYERCHEAKLTHIAASLRSAELWAKEKLGVAFETEYSAKVSRRPYVTAQAVKRFCPMSGGREYRPVRKTVTFEQPIHYVPSVGDLGYTP